ncbi:MAG: molybdopterin-dependent oxidoreductase [Acidobacteriota bacterium]|nr:molybdopterin-dependent oxidoreductase [Acidobacteriota bacterium]
MRVIKIDRREFVKLTSAASAGLILAVQMPRSAVASDSKSYALGAFLEIGTDGTVTIYVPQTEMGQGVRTALPMLIAEELDADWDRVRIKQADLDKKYGDQGTGGSGSVSGRFMPLRKAGATARAMLVAAAAARWGVDPKECSVTKGVITHGTKRLTFGEVAEAAAKLPVPAEVALKDPAKFTIIGQKVHRIDTPDIASGKAIFGSDVRVPGMLYAVVLRSPVFGGKVASFDDTKAKAMAGVKHVVKIDAVGVTLPWSGVAVVADSTWKAIQGRNALEVKWDEGPHAAENSADLQKAMQAGMSGPPTERFRNHGDFDAALSAAAKIVEAEYEVPFLAHATMEPQNATASVGADAAEVWAPTQFPDPLAKAAAGMLKIKPENVKVHVTLAGGGFGRRINNDYALEAVLISKEVGAPVHVHWTREDDMTHDFYRPPGRYKLTGGLDANGKLVAYKHRVASPTVRAYYRGPKAADLAEARTLDVFEIVPNSRGEFVIVDCGVPRGWWRSVGAAANTFVLQSFYDELAHAAGKDAIDFQLTLLGDGLVIPSTDADEKDFPFRGDRMKNVIATVRDRSGWGKPLPAGHAHGFATVYDSLTYCAEVAEVSIAKDGTPRVHRVTAAIDCGLAVNPDGIAAQVEGGIAFGLSAALYGEITLKNGRVEQSNFHDYPVLRIDQMPAVETHIIPSTALPTGTGEPPVPPIAPAVANAIFALTGKRVRKLPFQL